MRLSSGEFGGTQTFRAKQLTDPLECPAHSSGPSPHRDFLISPSSQPKNQRATPCMPASLFLEPREDGGDCLISVFGPGWGRRASQKGYWALPDDLWPDLHQDLGNLPAPQSPCLWVEIFRVAQSWPQASGILGSWITLVIFFSDLRGLSRLHVSLASIIR